MSKRANMEEKTVSNFHSPKNYRSNVPKSYGFGLLNKRGGKVDATRNALITLGLIPSALFSRIII